MLGSWNLVCRLVSLARPPALDRRGAVAVAAAVLIVPLVAFVGLATDAARGFMTKGRLSQAVDAAALAGGRDLDSPDVNADIQRYFTANFPAGFMAAAVAPLQIQPGVDGESLELVATATVPTTFLSVLGVADFTVSARAVVQRAVRGMELVLVMDNTGSMRSGGKIDAMKDAAHALIDLLYGDREVVDDFWVALVPYAATVNIGTSHADWLQNYDPAAYAPTVWRGCVEARPAPQDSTDAPPADLAWNPHFWPSTIDDFAAERAAGMKGDNDWPPVDEANAAQNEGTGPNLGCGPAITSLVQEKTAVHAAISEMEPWHRGGTMANLGLAWGWRTVSPRWRGQWGGATPADMPLDYEAPLMDKVVILLTDGQNQWYDWPDGLPGKPDAGTYPDADYTAYGRLSEGRLGTTNSGAATTEINTRMLNLCSAMKAEGVIIYTITFQLSNATTKQLYRDCASKPENYFDSPDNETLAANFQAIGVELSNLRLAE